MRTKVLFAKQNHARNHSHTHTSGSRICMYVHKFSMSRYYSFLFVRLLLYLNFIEDTQIMAINISPQSSILVKIPTKFRLRARTDHTNDTNTHTNTRIESHLNGWAFHTVLVGSLNSSVATKQNFGLRFLIFLFCLDVNKVNFENKTMHYLRATMKDYYNITLIWHRTLLMQYTILFR